MHLLPNRVFVEPSGYTHQGEYTACARSGVMAAGLAADAEIYQFRTNVTGVTLKQILVTEVSLWALTDTTGFTAGSFVFRLSQARLWSGSGTGGSTLTFTGNNSKLRTTMPGTILSTAGSGVRIATTAALGAGTKTLDLNGVRELAGVVGTGAFASMVSPLGMLIGSAVPNYPLVLTTNEGFVITATVPATGTWTFGVSVRWEETGGYPS